MYRAAVVDDDGEEYKWKELHLSHSPNSLKRLKRGYIRLGFRV